MNEIKAKVSSQSGASITFALLIFLVCTVLSSVIIVAATTASGRMSQMAESDQRYFCVTSAAELLKDILDGKTVSIVTVETKTGTTVYSDGSPGTTTYGTSTVNKYLIEKKAGDINETNDFVSANEINAKVISSIELDAAKRIGNIAAPPGLPISNREFALSSSANSVLDCKIFEDISTGGDITLTVQNSKTAKGGASGLGTMYSLKLYFMADKTDSPTSTRVKTISSTPGSGGTYTVVTETTTIDITSIIWTLESITTSA